MERSQQIFLIFSMFCISSLCLARTWPTLKDFHSRQKRQLEFEEQNDLDQNNLRLSRDFVGSLPGSSSFRGFSITDDDSTGPIPVLRPNLAQPEQKPKIRKNGNKIPIRANTEIVFVSHTVTETVVNDVSTTVPQAVPTKTVFLTQCTFVHAKGEPQTVYQTVTSPATTVTALIKPTLTVTKLVDSAQGSNVVYNRQPPNVMTITRVPAHGLQSAGYSYQAPKVPFGF